MATKEKTPALAGNPVWCITGCSTGFGRELAKHTLELGWPTVVTARNTKDIADLAASKLALALELDVTDQRQVDACIKKAEQECGRIDVLVNNAGIGYFGAVEESEEEQVRRMFEINFFGACRMINAVLPGMRARRKGCIVNISSIGGLRSFPSVGYYNATKFALEGLSEALWQEVEPLGIRVMCIEPSGFRTDWAGRSAETTRRCIDDYKLTAGATAERIRASSGNQPGDPARAARAIVLAVMSQHPPRRLLLGNNAYHAAMVKLKELRREFSEWEEISRGADFPQEARAQAAQERARV